jgi:hypothetical protein
MLKYPVSVLTALLFVAMGSTTARGQNLCPAGVSSDKLICVIPQAFGINESLPLTSLNKSQFQVDTLNRVLRPLDSAIARESALLPLASPSSGITYSWDPGSRTFVSSTDSLGPILGERAETVGRYRVFLGLDYQYFKFDTLDGADLKRLPVVLAQLDDSSSVPGRTCTASPPDATNNSGPCGFIRDVVRTTTRLDLKIHQTTFFAAYGISNKIDVSMAIPILNVRLGATSTATIVNNSLQFVHSFANCNCLTNSFSNVRTASGIGDMTFRVKGTAWKGERAAVALGVDVRVPTGDQLNFMGAGAPGVKPFVVGSYRWSRISPHAFVGYETNGSSLIAGDVSAGTKEKLPSQLTYSGGADVWFTKWLTGAFDLVGQQVFQAQRIAASTFQELGACKDSFCGECPQPPGSCSSTFFPANTDPTLSTLTGSYNVTNASIGAKIRPFASLVVTGNVQIKVNGDGLRARVIPLGGISYTF